MSKRQIGLIYFAFLTFFMNSCTSEKPKTEDYIAIYKRDTAYLSLNMYADSYHGKMIIKGPAENRVTGDVQGKIQGDTLLGDFLYRPYKTKLEKRRPFALKQIDDKLIEGTGLEHVYMGIPYYDPASLHFDSPKFIFNKIQ